MNRTVFIIVCAMALGLFWGAGACGKTEVVSVETPSVAQPSETVPKSDATSEGYGFAEKPANGTKAKCPVMKNEFVVKDDTQFSEHNGKHYAFCCPGCKPQFDENPDKFLRD